MTKLTRKELLGFVESARKSNREALRFRKLGKPSVANYHIRQRNLFMRWARGK